MLELLHFGFDPVGDVQGVGAGQLPDGQADGRVHVEGASLVVALSASSTRATSRRRTTAAVGAEGLVLPPGVPALLTPAVRLVCTRLLARLFEVTPEPTEAPPPLWAPPVVEGPAAEPPPPALLTGPPVVAPVPPTLLVPALLAGLTTARVGPARLPTPLPPPEFAAVVLDEALPVELELPGMGSAVGPIGLGRPPAVVIAGELTLARGGN